MIKKTIQRITLVASVFVLVSNAYAIGEGVYAGIQAGQSNLNNEKAYVYPSTELTSPDNTGFGARAFAGYNINQYFGGEMGYTYYSPSTYGTAEIRAWSIDLMGKVMWPLFYGIGVYGKAGAAFLRQNASDSLSNATDKQNYFSPAAAGGVEYNFYGGWVADVSYARVFGGGGLQPADLFSVGISYHIVDKYCGQFLC